ncbi:PIG-L deacetylase family protein [Saccharopolyspora spinosporotrichia]
MTTAPDSPTGTRRALVVAAHPDDVDFGSAGTVASWTAAGMRVTYCICTNGDAGGFDATARADMPVIRQQEQRAAAAAVGVTDVHFLGYRDGQVSADLQLRRDITRMIRTVRPDRVLTHSPEINWARIAMSHPDHRAVGEATLAAVYPDARNEFAHPDLLLQHGLRPGWCPSCGCRKPPTNGPTGPWTSPTTSRPSSPRCRRTARRPGTWTTSKARSADTWRAPPSATA